MPRIDFDNFADAKLYAELTVQAFHLKITIHKCDGIWWIDEKYIEGNLLKGLPYDTHGYSEDGYSLYNGWHKYGYIKGYDINGYDKRGFNRNGLTKFDDRYNAAGFNDRGNYEFAYSDEETDADDSIRYDIYGEFNYSDFIDHVEYVRDHLDD